MNWDALGAVGELVGSVGVVVTLAYFAVQTKNSSKAAQSNSTNQSRAAVQDVMGMIASDGEAMAIYYTGMTEPASLDPQQQVRFDLFIFLQLRGTETMFWEHRDKLLSDDLWEAQWRAQQRVLSSRGGQESWLRQQDFVSTKFKDWITTELA